jgi:rubrerythrin
MNKQNSVHHRVVKDLLFQVLETEQGGVKIYETALQCVINADLKQEWTNYLAQTKRHVVIATDLLVQLGLDPLEEVPCRQPVRAMGEGLLAAMKAAMEAGDAVAAQLTACDCVIEAETKDHQNWSLVGTLIEKGPTHLADVLRPAFEEVEPEEDHHLYHSTGWGRELWIQAPRPPRGPPAPRRGEAGRDGHRGRPGQAPEGHHARWARQGLSSRGPG